MPSACAERDRFDLCGSLHPASPRFAPSLRFASLIFGAFSTRAIYLKFEICGLSIAAHAPKNVVRRTGRRRRSRSDAQAPARQIESVTSMHDIRQVRIPRRITRTARICRRATLDSQTWQMTSQQARVDDKSSWPHFCVRQRRLREKRTWLNKINSHPSTPPSRR